MKQQLHLKELVSYLNTFLASTLISDVCPNGLQVEGKDKIRKIATAVSASLETIKDAVQQGIDALIVHHGIFWDNEKPILIGTKCKKLHLLLEHEISLIAYHLPLDIHPEVGNNWKAATDLGWENKHPFGQFKGMTIGVKGEFEPMEIGRFIQNLETYYQHKAIKAMGGKKIVQTAALVSGGAHQLILAAAQDGVDCFITGNFDEPDWFIAQEENIHFMALGHHATEKIGPKTLAEHLKIKFDIETQFLDSDNPF